MHEDGRRTLGETIFDARHHLREIPVAFMYVAALMLAAGIRPTRAVLGAGLPWLLLAP